MKRRKVLTSYTPYIPTSITLKTEKRGREREWERACMHAGSQKDQRQKMKWRGITD